MPKTHILEKENGTFIFFFEYGNEEKFDSFLKFICKKLKVSIPHVENSPYSFFAYIEYDGEVLTASSDGGFECYLHIPKNSQISAKKLVKRCYGFFS